MASKELSSVEAEFEQDRRAAAAVASGDRNAAGAVASRLMGRVRALTFYLAAGHSEAEDMAQNAMIEVLRSLRTYRGESRLEAWGDRIVTRHVVRQLKDARRRGGVQVSHPDIDSFGSGTGAAGSIDQRISARVVASLRELKPIFRTALVLKLVAGYTVAEIAEMTEAPPHTVRTRLADGRKKLQAKLRRDPLVADWIRTVER